MSGMVGETLSNEVKKLGSALLQGVERLYILREIEAFQVGNKPAGEVAPVTLTEQRSLHHLFSVRLCNDGPSVDRASQIACHKGIDSLISKPLAQLQCLLPPCFGQHPLGLSLHDLVHIIKRFTMPDQI